jgi:hypothetical protein
MLQLVATGLASLVLFSHSVYIRLIFAMPSISIYSGPIGYSTILVWHGESGFQGQASQGHFIDLHTIIRAIEWF